jgi:DNA-binding MurR/RpiR family transcriptional regulator
MIVIRDKVLEDKIKTLAKSNDVSVMTIIRLGIESLIFKSR